MRELVVHGPQSRVVLARKLGLSRTSLSRLTKELEVLGLLDDGEMVRSPTPGRPQERVQIRSDAAFFYGIELAQGRIHGVVIDLTATVLFDHTEPLEGSEPAEVVDRIVAVGARLAADAPDAVGLGVGVPGTVFPAGADGFVVRSRRLGWENVPLAEMLRPRVEVPVSVVNETVALTGAHQWFGAARGNESLVLFAIGSEVESGIAVFDELMEGTHGRAGRVGHARLLPDGAATSPVSEVRCVRGHDNCVHAFLTQDAIALNAGFRVEEYSRAVAAARYNDHRAVRAFDLAAEALGIAIADAANLLEPQTILVTGEAADVMDISTDRLHSSLLSHLDSLSVEELDLRRPGFRYSQYAQGAAIAAILDRFRDRV